MTKETDPPRLPVSDEIPEFDVSELEGFPDGAEMPSAETLAEDRRVLAEYEALSEEEKSEFDYQVALQGPHLDGALLPKLVMMIVRGNPLGDNGDGTSDRTRVDRALKALLGPQGFKSTRRQATKEALRLMAREFLADRGGHRMNLPPHSYRGLDHDPPSARSIKALAELASREVAGAPAPNSLKSETNREDLVRRAIGEIHASDVPGSLQQQSLEIIGCHLRAHGIIPGEKQSEK